MTDFRIIKDDSAREVLSFWFGQLSEQDWFVQNAVVDAALAQQLGHLVAPAGRGDFAHWLDGPLTALALIIVLDQLPRNLNRGSARSFIHDAKALATSRALIARFEDDFRAMSPQQKLFVLLPFEHAEDITAQDEGVGWFEQLAPMMTGKDAEFWASVTDYAYRHREPIARFGRFPHRNAVLGRQTTADEAAWLEQHPAGF
jgi:uncharacterized protein (DUF924 family)